MTKDTAIRVAVGFLIFGVLFAFFGFLFGIESNRTTYALWGFSLLFYIVSFYLKPEQKEWICQNCNEKLVRSQIKFGLCPKCGTKVEGFRGLRPHGMIYDGFDL